MIARDLLEHLHPWLRAQLLIRRILGTRWDKDAWPTMREELKQVLRLRSAIRRDVGGIDHRM